MSDFATLALAYIGRGWAVIPVPLGRKAPRIRRWRDLRIGLDDVPRYFKGRPTNIGVLLGEPSGGHADIDLDCPEALTLSDEFLPATGLIFGRPTKPRSHRLYVVPDAKSARYADPLGGMLVELRFTGGMTIFPPSTHPSGEAIAWDTDGEPASVKAAMLVAACERLATACLVARHLGADALTLPEESWPERLNAVDPRLGAAARDWLCHTVTPNVKAGVTRKAEFNQSCNTCHTCHTSPEVNAREGGTEQQVTAAHRAYALAAIEGEAAEVARTKPGSESDRLNQAARKMAEFVNAGALQLEEVGDCLAAAAAQWENDQCREPWTEREILRVIESGLVAGLAARRVIFPG